MALRSGTARPVAPRRRASDAGVTLGPVKPRQPGRIDASRHRPASVPTLAGTWNSGPGGGKLQVELVLWGRPCRRDRRGPRRQADPFQVSTDRAGVGNGGNDLHAAPTGGAFGDVKLEHSGQKYRPGQPVPPLGGGPLSVTGGRSQRLYMLFRRIGFNTLFISERSVP